MSNEIIPYPPITKADKEGIPDFRVPDGIDERALKMLGCDCGTVFNVVGSLVKNGTTKSCGCLRAENNKNRHKH